MKKYPEVITDVIGLSYIHITDEEVVRDIEETEREIACYERMIEGQEILSKHHVNPGNAQMYALRVSSSIGERDQRREFVKFLQRLQDWRRSRVVPSSTP